MNIDVVENKKIQTPYLSCSGLRDAPRHQYRVHWTEAPHPQLPYHHGARSDILQPDRHSRHIWILQGGCHRSPNSQISQNDFCFFRVVTYRKICCNWIF